MSSSEVNPERSAITLGHLSDLHATDPSRAPVGSLFGKRFFGWLSWKLRRSKEYRREVVEALFVDLKSQAPDQVAVTGDLINISLETEFEIAGRILRNLGDPSWVSLVPGNHDAYVGVPYERAWAHWEDYLVSDSEAEAIGGNGANGENSNMFSFPGALPSIRIRGELALVGVCSAIPTPPFIAAGTVGSEQLDRLANALSDLGSRGLCRVVLVHHPVVDDHVSPRRRLSDAAGLRKVIEGAGAELVIHGHNHRSEFKVLDGPTGEIPVVGVRSASYAGNNPEKTAQYHLYQFEKVPAASGSRYRVALRVRGWNAGSKRFEEIGASRPLPRV